jgi:phage/conjugal plasmid C-4 type zinc finger TraR family protein
MDYWDRSSKTELRQREESLAMQQEAVQAADKPAYSHCEDCGEEIPVARRALRGVTRCVPCQVEFEKQQRMKAP